MSFSIGYRYHNSWTGPELMSVVPSGGTLLVLGRISEALQRSSEILLKSSGDALEITWKGAMQALWGSFLVSKSLLSQIHQFGRFRCFEMCPFSKYTGGADFARYLASWQKQGALLKHCICRLISLRALNSRWLPVTDKITLFQETDFMMSFVTCSAGALFHNLSSALYSEE